MLTSLFLLKLVFLTYGTLSITFVFLPTISGNFFHLLITFVNNLNPDQDQPGSKLFESLKVFLKELFENINFEKSQQTTKAWKITQHAVSIKILSSS